MNTVTNELVITSAGRISRETFYVRDRPENFYVQGSLGATLGIGIGVALNTKKKVIVIAGDGDILISLGTLVLLKKLQWEYEKEALKKTAVVDKNNLKKINEIIEDGKFNLNLYILDNNQYQSTGGQPTVSNHIDFRMLCDCKVIYCGDSEMEVPRINIPHQEIKKRFMNAVKA